MKAPVKIAMHVGLMILTVVVLIIVALFSLRKYTRHDVDIVKVPEIEGLRVDRAISLLEDEGFEYEISDTVYKDGAPLMAVIDQDPDSGYAVKPGRRIYLVVNASKVPMVKMPRIAGSESYRSALVMLRASGLQLGNRIEKPSMLIKDPDSEPVLEQRYHNDTTAIKPGAPIRRNSKVDLVVGVMVKERAMPDTSGFDAPVNINTDDY